MHMKFYLSSFRTGTETDKLKELTASGNRKVAFITNAMDDLDDIEFRNKIEGNDKSDLEELGLKVNHIDLREYFARRSELVKEINECDVIWCTGGNAFVLLQAMKLSGLDSIIKDLYVTNLNKVYGGFSAGTYILGPTLDGMHLVDEPENKPYGEQYNTEWNGLGILDYVIVPHYKSDHFESMATEDAIQYLIEKKTLFRALKDGEVIIIE